VRLIPLPNLQGCNSELESLSLRALELSIEYVGGDERSRHYRGDWVSTVARVADSPFLFATQRASEIAGDLRAVERRINEIVEYAYGLSHEDLQTMSARIGPSTAQALPGSVDLIEGGTATAAREHCSALIGAAVGRWDLDAFETSCATDRGAPFAALPKPKPLRVPRRDEGILADDEGHSDDIVASVEAHLSFLWGNDYPTVSAEFLSLLGGDLRRWIRLEFWPYHLARYSFSQAKAPIYWQLATPSASYSIWLYIHAFTKDTLFRVQNDYAAPKLAHEERRLESLFLELRDKATAAQRKELAAQEAFVVELRAFLEEVKRVTPLWNPYPDDGVIINFSPLWRLVPHHKAWQKELKATWDSLCEGEHDWTHLAMHLWPHRVVPKCATDRSLAIAHGLEEVFWVEGEGANWKPRETQAHLINALVADRSSQAVKAALRNLIEAPDPAGPTKRGRKSKAL
jgi:hypothetical protein